MSTFVQDAILDVLQARRRQGLTAISAADVGWSLQPRLPGLAATSALRALERRELVTRIPPADRWSVAKWVARPKTAPADAAQPSPRQVVQPIREEKP